MSNYHFRNTLASCLALYVWFGGFPLTSAGVCWRTSDVSSGLCQRAILANITRDDCCSIQGLANVSWSPHTSLSDVFYLNFFTEGAGQCHRCHRSCHSVECKDGLTCQMKSGRPTCVCKPRCGASQRRKGSVCGSDEHRYRNVCALQAHNCYHNTNVYVKYHGRCRRSCKRVHCDEGKSCIEDQNGLAHCVQCGTLCSRADKLSSPVCGVNGLTYPSICHLRTAICQKGRSIQIAYQGKCNEDKTCRNAQCKDTDTCLLNPMNGQPVCSSCEHIYNLREKRVPLCGTDGRTYRSYCQMKESSCKHGIYVTTLMNGHCRNDTLARNFDLVRFQPTPNEIHSQNDTYTLTKRYRTNRYVSRHRRHKTSKFRDQKRQKQSVSRREPKKDMI